MMSVSTPSTTPRPTITSPATIRGAYGSIRVLNATPDEVSFGIEFFYV
jgi:hypothetical protein